MIELFIQIIVAIFLIALIFFLTEYTLKFRQERLKLEDHRNSILKEEQRINEENSIAAHNREKHRKEKEHQDKLANGYKYYEWRGIITYIHRNIFDPGIIMKTTLEYKNGQGYFKSENDLSNWLLAQSIVLKWCREL